MKTAHYVEAEGLRAYMALWVALGHALQFSGITPSNPILKVILNGDAAVTVFILLSGFVITHLLVSKQEHYLPYIVRRFMRLMPAFLVCCVVGYFMAGALYQYTANVPWHAEPYTREMAASRWVRFTEVRDNLPPHVLAHLTMLHGAIPRNFLPEADRTFLAPGWSISLEWQFYLLAPMVIACLRRPIALAALAGGALLLFLAFERGMLGEYKTHSFIAGASGFFAVGIASRLLLPRLAELKYPALGWGVAAAVVAAMLAERGLPLAIWVLFVAYLGGWLAGVDARVFRWLFANRVARYLGQISYSLYLCHVLIMVALGQLSLALMPDLSKSAALIVQLSAIAMAIPVSALMHSFIEKPGITLGSAWAKRLTPRSERRKAPADEIALAGGIEGGR